MSNSYKRGKKGGSRSAPPKEEFKKNLQAKWIADENGLDREAIGWAHRLGRHLGKELGRHESLTTTQIRNFFGEVKRIESKGFEQAKGDFQLLLPKLHYAAKRANKKGTFLFRDVMEKAHQAVRTPRQFQRFVQLLEAVLAYHRAEGGH